MIPASVEPVEVRHERGARRVVVSWSDGHSSSFPLDYLRNSCPCAVCRGHAGERQPVEQHDQELVHLEAVGNYALSLTWQDGHNTGIYSFRLLRQLCPCETCGGPKGSN